MAFEPIAIVGMGCRFPGGLNDITALWNALKNRFQAVDVVPGDRWSADRYFSSDPIAKGKAYVRRGNFLNQNVRTFDAGFFGISPRDAENMDPQQRLLLEVAWEAFENSGMCLPEYAKRAVGVYVGGFMLDHMITQMGEANRSAINPNTATGMMMTMLSNRISHTFDFRGPSLSIDTACSSSLVAFNYACHDLWYGNCEMAVVGGVNVMLRPEYPMGMCKGQFLARDGECKSFDDRGDGYGRGEGAGIVLLKPLSVAIANGDPVLATVIGSGSNQDGRTPGISMPNGDSQQELIESVCRRFNIPTDSIDYVECHGTGTGIGDPTEAGAIGRVYGNARKEHDKSPVIIGSVKSNIGHLEAGAGVAGVIKATLTLLHRETYPLANLQEVNPRINFNDLHVQLADELRPLPAAGDIRAAVNSFGYGGSNAHVILQSAPAELLAGEHLPAYSSQRQSGMPYYLPLSARSDGALRALAEQYQALLQSGADCEDVLYSASFHRAALSHRAIIRGQDQAELLAGLQRLAAGEACETVVCGTEPFQGDRRPVFVFTGMGPQWWAMGQELYAQDPNYRNAVDEADEVFKSISGFSILHEMLKSEEESTIQRTELAQPANFMVQIGLMAMLASHGVKPGAVVGHSVGELASAYASGVLTLRDAMTVCFHRSRLQAECRGTGSMLAVGLGKDKVSEWIAPFADKVSVAAANGPSNVTIAGDSDAIAEIATQLAAANIFNKELQVEVPYHSPMMDPILDELREALARVQPSLPNIPLYSTVTGERVEGITYGCDYWPQNVRQPVEFAVAINNLLADGYCYFLEVGPHPVLATSIADCIRTTGSESRQAFTLRRMQPEVHTFQQAVMKLAADGCQLDWSHLTPAGTRVDLPTYPWQRDELWVENERAMANRIAPIVHPLLGYQEVSASPVYRNDFDHEPVRYLRDHVVSGVPILPAAGFVEILLELGLLQHPEAPGMTLRNLSIEAAMLITADRGLDCVTSFDPQTRHATIRSLENGRLGEGQTHVTADVSALWQFEPNTVSLSKLQQEIAETLDVADFYKQLSKIGLEYGPAFQTIKSLAHDHDRRRILSRVELNHELAPLAELYCLHPSVLDACFQSLMPMLRSGDTTFLPTGFQEMSVYSRHVPAQLWCTAECVRLTKRRIECDLSLIDDHGQVVASIRGMQLSAASRRERMDQFGDRVKLQILEYAWSYGEALTEPKRLGHWLVFGDDSPVAQQAMDHMERYGATIVGMAALGANPQSDGRRHVVRPQSTEDMLAMLDTMGQLDGVVCLHGLASRDASDDPTGQNAVEALTTLTKCVAQKHAERPPRMYVVTQCAHATNDQDDEVKPAQTAINGFVRVAFNEFDGFRFSSVDLPQHCNEAVVENLALELLCDDSQDEVALRGSLRLCSELAETKVLNDDVVRRQRLDDDHPVQIRALRADVESVGTARIIEQLVTPVGPEELRIAVESLLVPSNLLLDPDRDPTEPPTVQFLGHVLHVGEAVRDFQPGQRVCGLGPADVASQLTVDQHSICLVACPQSMEMATTQTDDVPAHEAVLSVLLPATLAMAAVERIRTTAISAGVDESTAPAATALVQATHIGQMIGQTLVANGVRVAYLHMANQTRSMANTLGDATCSFSYCPEGIAAAKREMTAGAGFDLLVVEADHYTRYHSLHILSEGGTLVDLSSAPGMIDMPAHLGGLIRTDLKTLLRHQRLARESMSRAIEAVMTGAIASGPTLNVSVQDLAWQKLPLSDNSVNLNLSFGDCNDELPVVQVDKLGFDAHGTFLITGGFGGFGRKTAEWLIDNGARHLVLTGRTGADTPERLQMVRDLEAAGASVIAAACDTADYATLKKLIDDIDASEHPLRGVFHSGAVIQDEPIVDIDMQTLNRVMQSKATGAWNLHLLTRDKPLDHFVLYSSLANLVGNSRQAAYSAANGFLNGLAHMRAKQGLPATSVNWGAIADVGVVAQDEKLEQFLRYTGLRGIESAEGLELLLVGLGRHVTQFGVTVITNWSDWARFETRGAKSPRFATLIQNDSKGQDDSTRQALLQELAGLVPEDQVELLSALIVEIVAVVLKSSPEEVPLDKALSQLGVDSLMATEIQLTLDNQLGLQVSIMELIGETTIRKLAMNSLTKLLESEALSR